MTSKYAKVTASDKDELIQQMGQVLYDRIPAKCELLDVGCSTGYFGSLIQQDKDCVVDGIEIDAADAKEASTKLRKVYTFDLEMPWPESITKNRYDIIFMGDVLEHLRQPDDTLTKVSKLLKPGGAILLSTPNIAHISIWLELIKGNFKYESLGILDETHVKYFTRETLLDFADKAGLKATTIDGSIDDYSEGMIIDWLKEVGLEPTPKFWEYANSRDARTYQFKIIFEPIEQTTGKKTVDAGMKPHQYKYQYKESLAATSKQLQELQKLHEDLQKHAQEQADELIAIKSSKKYKIAQKVAKPAQSIKRIIK